MDKLRVCVCRCVPQWDGGRVRMRLKEQLRLFNKLPPKTLRSDAIFGWINMASRNDAISFVDWFDSWINQRNYMCTK